MSKMKPCPFCGEAPNLEQFGIWFNISCDCLMFLQTHNHKKKIEAINEWNTRVEDAPPDLSANTGIKKVDSDWISKMKNLLTALEFERIDEIIIAAEVDDYTKLGEAFTNRVKSKIITSPDLSAYEDAGYKWWAQYRGGIGWWYVVRLPEGKRCTSTENYQTKPEAEQACREYLMSIDLQGKEKT